MEIVNKYFKRKNSTDESVKITNVDSGFAIFENGARCKLETLLNDFEVVEILQEQKVTTKYSEPDPNNFFDTPLKDDALLAKIGMIAEKPGIEFKPTIELKPSIDLTENKVISTNSNQIEDRMQEQTQPQNTNPLVDRFSSSSESVHNNNTQRTNEVVYANPNSEPAEYKVFNNVKKTDELDILIPFTIKLPKAQKIDVLNDMFESSFIDYLANKEVDALLKDKKALVNIIIEQLTDWLDNELYGKGNKKSVKKKVAVGKKTPVVKKNKAKKSTETKEEKIDKIESVTTTDESFGRQVGMVIVDVPTEIKSEDDLNRINAYIEELYAKEQTPDINAQIIVYEDIVALYMASLNNN